MTVKIYTALRNLPPGWRTGEDSDGFYLRLEITNEHPSDLAQLLHLISQLTNENRRTT